MSNHNKEGFNEDFEEEMLDLENEVKVLINFDVANSNHVLQEWEWRRRMCVVQLVCHIVHLIYLLGEMSTLVDRPISDGNYERESMRRIFMKQLEETEKCRDVIRMGPQAFLHLCAKLRNTGKVKDSRNVTVEEQVAKFLHTLAHNVRSRTMAFYFNRSRETISRHFRGRKDYPTQNIFAACSFDMKFTYVLAGWEGTASDARILKNALSRDGNIIIPQGKFYLGDAGFPLKRGILTPYRGVRYHLKEYSTRSPQNAREIFNHRHASLRNVIERTFGVLKKRFPIIGSGTEPHFPLETMVDIVIACCILHNFLMGVDPDETLISEVDRELSCTPNTNDQFAPNQEEDYRQGSIIRDNIAGHMWHDYSSHVSHEL